MTKRIFVAVDRRIQKICRWLCVLAGLATFVMMLVVVGRAIPMIAVREDTKRTWAMDGSNGTVNISEITALTLDILTEPGKRNGINELASFTT